MIKSCLALFLLFLSFAAAGRQPHIVFVVADDLGWNDVGAHGSDIRTPHIDALIDEGVELTQYYVQYQCTPTRAAFLSGRYPISNGMQHGVILPCESYGVPRNTPFISNSLKSAGYRTAAIGKWHLGQHKWDFAPTRRGFDSFYGLLYGKGDYWNHTLKIKGKNYQDMWRNEEPAKNHRGIYSTFLFVNETEKVLKEKSPTHPLFLYLAFTAPHEPHHAPESYFAMYKGVKPTNRMKHSAMTTALDDAVGDVKKLLVKYGYWDDTVLVFSSDNGGSTLEGGNNWPLRGGKFTLFEGGQRVIGFVNSPLLGVGKNRKSKALMHAVDWYPTFLHLASSPARKSQRWLDGVNQWETIRNAADKGPRKEILYNIDPLMKRDNRLSAAVRRGPYKLITGFPCRKLKECGWRAPKRYKSGGKGDGIMLFNLRTDPNEKKNIAKAHPKLVKNLMKRIKKYQKRMVKPLNKNIKPDPRCPVKKKPLLFSPWIKS
jgi:arylsulfatase A-like enzyme